MAMMKTMIAIEMINDGNGDNEISNDDSDDSDSNDYDYAYTRQSVDLIRVPKGSSSDFLPERNSLASNRSEGDSTPTRPIAKN